MSDSRAKFNAAMRRAAEDKSFRDECLADGRAFLRAADVDPGSDINVETHVNDSRTLHIVIPAQAGRELGDPEMSGATGGIGFQNTLSNTASGGDAAATGVGGNLLGGGSLSSGGGFGGHYVPSLIAGLNSGI